MSMTREEAIELVCYGDWLNILMSELGDDDINRLAEAMCIIGSALRPVSRERVEKVFPGCPACKNGPPKIHIPAFRAMAVCNQHMDHAALDIELNSQFVLN